MAKGQFVKSLVETAEKAGLLDMSEAARMERARELGFDIDTIYYHESKNPGQVEQIHGGGRFGGIFTLQNDRAGYYDNVQGFYLKGDPATNSDIRDFADENLEDVKGIIKNRFNVDDDEAENVLDQVVTFESLPADLDADYYADLQKTRAELAKKMGANSVIQEDEFGKSVQLLPGSGVRSVNAAFDPAKKESSNLLAGVLPAAAGLGALAGGSENVSAEERARQTLSSPLTAMDRLAYASPNTGTIEAPRNETYSALADLAGGYNKWRKNKVHPLLDLALPVGELPEDELRSRSYGDRVPYWQSVLAGLGMM